MTWPRIQYWVVAAVLTVPLSPATSSAEMSLRKIGELEIPLFGVVAGLDPIAPVVPKGVASGVRVVINVGGKNLTYAQAKTLFGTGIGVEGLLSGPGLTKPQMLSGSGTTPQQDALFLPLPAFETGGDYTLTNVRVVKNGAPVVDAQPRTTTVKVVDQVLVTSVTTRPLTLAELEARGIVLDSSSYSGFEFNLAMQLESKPVNLSFPVVFDSAGVALPQPLIPPLPQGAGGVPLPFIEPMMLEIAPPVGGGAGERLPPLLPSGKPVRIPAVLVIPGNMGFLDQHFSAMLYVANGAPAGSGLTVRDVTGTIELPKGPDGVIDTPDDPLVIATRADGTTPKTLTIKGPGPDGQPDTPDDALSFAPAEQGQAEFVVRGEKEGFHELWFQIAATLDGLPVGPVNITGKASGGVLVRNARFDLAFTVPATVRYGEPFRMFATVTNIGDSPGNSVHVTITEGALSHLQFAAGETGARVIPTLLPGEAETLEFSFRPTATGRVVATYLDFDSKTGIPNSTGSLRFKLGVGERGVPLSPDTLVLPSAVDALPSDVVTAAMRVLGQAWSIAGAPAGTLPRDVIRTNRTVVTQKALALAEAGLRVTLGQGPKAAVRDLLLDFWGGTPLDPGFDQLLATTEAGRRLAEAIGEALATDEGAVSFERDLAELAAAGPDFLTFAFDGAGDVQVADGVGRGLPAGKPVPGLARVKRGGSIVGVITAPTSFPYTFTPGVSGEGSATFVGPDNVPRRATWSCSSAPEIVIDPAASAPVVARAGEAACPVTTQALPRVGPRLLSATIVGPETLSGAGMYGFHVAFLFDRVVDAASAATTGRYQLQANKVLSAKRQMSGRLVFGNLAQPEHTYIAREVVAGGVTDQHGTAGAQVTVPLASRLQHPGAVVSGRVLQADGTVVTRGQIVYANTVAGGDIFGAISCQGAMEAGLAAVPLGSDGRYELRYVRQGECGGWTIKVQDPLTGALRHVSGQVRAAGEHIVMDIVLLGRGSVQGVVYQSGSAVGGAQVLVKSVTDPQSAGVATTDGTGAYRVDGITVGPVTAVAAKRMPSGATLVGSSTGRIERAGTTVPLNVTILGTGVTVSGTVTSVKGTDPPTPVRGALVVYSLRQGGAPPVPMGYAFSSTSGDYGIKDMPAGAYSISATWPMEPAQNPVFSGTADSGAVRREITFAITPPDELASIRGRVLLPRNAEGIEAGAPDVIVSVDGRGVLTSPTGEFELRGLKVDPSTAREIVARSRDGKRTGRTLVYVTGNRTGVEIRLSGLGTASFQVLGGANGTTGIAGVSVGLQGSCADPCGCRFETTNAQGWVSFDDQPLGAVTAKALRVDGTKVDVATSTVTVARDGDTPAGIIRFTGFGTVRGTVYCPTTKCVPAGGPAHGAEVTLVSTVFNHDTCSLWTDRVSQTTRTATDGGYEFKDVHLGKVAVSATFPLALAPGGNGGTLVEENGTVTLDVRLVDGVSRQLTGIVYLPDGTTRAGAGVQVAARGATPEIVVTTQADGSYTFAKILREGYYVLTATDPTTGRVARDQVYLPKSTSADDGPMSFDLRLKGRGTVRLSVATAADEVVNSALVKLAETEYPYRSFESTLDPSDAGTVTIENVDEGRFSVEVSDSLGRGGRGSGVVPSPGGTTIDVSVIVTVTGSVEGTFRMPNETPIPFGTVKLTAGNRVIGQVTTGGSGAETGRFRFDYVPAGTFKLEAQDPLTARTGVAFGEIKVEGEILPLDVKATGLGTVRGEITQNGGPFTEPVHLDLVSGDYHVRTIATGGAYEVPGVPEGRVVVSASLDATEAFKGTASGTLRGDGGAVTIDVPLRGVGRVQGTVFSVDGETPAGVSLVTLHAGGPGGREIRTFSRFEDGGFEFEGVPAGEATLTADVLTSDDRGSVKIEVPSSQVPVDGSITLNGLGALELSGYRDGVLVDGFMTIVGTGPFPYTLYRYVEAASPTRVPNLLAGPVTVKFSHTPYPGAHTLYGTAAPDRKVVANQTTAILVHTQASATVTGSVVRADGTPAWGAEVTLTGGGIADRVRVGATGAFSAPGLPLPDVPNPVVSIDIVVTDPVTHGRAARRGLQLTEDGLNVGQLKLDDGAPRVKILSPGTATRKALGGLIDIEIEDEVGGSGLAPSTFVIRYPNGGSGSLDGLAFDGKRITGTLTPSLAVVGRNQLYAAVSDASGNRGEAFVEWTATGSSLTLRVLRKGLGVDGADVEIDGAPAGETDPDGSLVKVGLAPRTYRVAVIDPVSGLKTAPQDVVLHDGFDGAAEVSLPAFRPVTAHVQRPRQGGIAAPDGCVAKLMSAGVTIREVPTKDGDAVFGFVAEGTYDIGVSCPLDKDQGRSLPFTIDDDSAAHVHVPVTLNGIGAVEVTVRTAQGAHVKGADVFVTSSSPFGGSYGPVKTGDTGVAVFPHVLAGTLKVTATANGLSGEPLTDALGDGETLPLVFTLEAARDLVGTVFEANGTTPVEGVEVRLSGPRQDKTVTGPGGIFHFSALRLAGFVLEVTTSKDDRGRVERTLVSGDGPQTENVTLNGLGRVRVLVKTAGNTPIADASTFVVTRSPHLKQYPAQDTGGNGVAIFEDVLAGDIEVFASKDGLHGFVGGKVLKPYEELPVDVSLQAVGTIKGTVRKPDGVSAFDGARVVVGNQERTTRDGGAFEFAGLNLGTYAIHVYVGDRLRAHVPNVVLSRHDQVESREIPLIGVGTVSGHVTEAAPSTSSASGVKVTIRDVFGGPLPPATTESNGLFTIANVPVGTYRITAERASTRESVDDMGSVAEHEQPVTHNLRLLSSAVTLPAPFKDGNGLNWHIGTDGSPRSDGVFHSEMMLESSPRLALVKDGQSLSFAGPPDPDGDGYVAVASEEGRRELVVPQTLGGVQVTRKTYLPADGYFVRFLEILENPTSAAITVDVVEELRLNAATWWRPDAGVVDTSSGDASLGSDDAWVLFDDGDTTDIYTGPWWAPTWQQFAPLAVVSSGTGAAAAPSVVWDPSTRRATYRWDALTLEPGQRIALVFWISAQADRARGLATAQRLAQLPPEALVGLSVEEAAAIRNFAIPVDLSSALPSLPPLDGVVIGRVLGGDGQTPVVDSSFTFRSDSPHHGQPQLRWAPSPSAFRFENGPDGRVVQGPFTVRAAATAFGQTHTAMSTGSFATEGVRDITALRGASVRASTTPGGAPYAVDGSLASGWFSDVYDSSPFFEVVLPITAPIHEVRLRGPRNERTGITQARVEIRSATGDVLWQQEHALPDYVPGVQYRDIDVPVSPAVPGAVVRIVALARFDRAALMEVQVRGEAPATAPSRFSEIDVVFSGRGVVAGVVRRADGSLVLNAAVKLSNAQGSQTTTAPWGSAAFVFPVVPPGTYDLTATFPNNGASHTIRDVLVQAGLKTTQDVVFPAPARISGIVTSANGQPIYTGYTEVVELDGPVKKTVERNYQTGFYEFQDLPAGEYVVTAPDQNRSGVRLSERVQVAAGQHIPVNFSFPPAARVKVSVTSASYPAQGQRVCVQSEKSPAVHCGNTISDGTVVLPSQPWLAAGTFTVRVGNADFSRVYREVLGTVTAEGVQAQVSVEVPPRGTLRGNVRTRDGADAGVWLHVLPDEPGPYVPPAWTGGTFAINDVPFGGFRLRGENATDSGEYETAESHVTLGPAGQLPDPVSVTVSRGSLVANERNLWELLLREGVPVHIYARAGWPTTLDPYLELYAPDGTRVAANNDISPTDKGAHVEFTAPETGLYVVSVRGANQTSGPYSLRLGGRYNGEGQLSTDTAFRRVTAFASVHGRVLMGGTTPTPEATPAPGALSFTVSPKVVPAGGTVNVSWSGIVSPTRWDWIGLYPAGAANNGYLTYVYTSSCQGFTGSEAKASGSCSFRMGTNEGSYQFRLFPDDAYDPVLAVADIAVGGEPPAPVDGATVYVRYSVGDATQTASAVTVEDGTYLVTVVPEQAAVTAELRTPSGRTLVSKAGTTGPADSLLDLSLHKPGLGRVDVSATCGGQPCSGLPVTVSSDNTLADAALRTQTAVLHNGTLSFAEVPAGTITVTAQHPQESHAPREGTLADGGLLGAEFTFTSQPGGSNAAAASSTLVGAIEVTAVADDSGDALAGRVVRLHLDGTIARESTTDGQGKATFEAVRAGAFEISSGAPPDYGWADGIVAEGQTRRITLRIGNQVRPPVDLTSSGAVVVPRWAFGNGAIAATSGYSCDPACGTYARIGDDQLPLLGGAHLQQDGREVVLGPHRLASGLQLTRRVFVPASGAFARHLEILHNPTSQAVSVDVAVGNDHRNVSGQAWTVLGADGVLDASDNYAIVQDPGRAESAPLMVLVGSGLGASRPIGRYDFGVVDRGGVSYTAYGAVWEGITVAPGQTVILMSFTSSSAPGDAAAAGDKAERLMNLSEPGVLDGLTSTERLQIVNFQVSP